MYIIIAGGGMVGGGLTRRLLAKKHDVVLIESDKSLCDQVYAHTGVIAINGSAAEIEVLKDAGINKADIVVVATGDDAVNLACAILAKSLGVSEVIVRMRNPEFENAYKLAGVDTTLRVTDVLIDMMMMEIEKPEVKRITSIGAGRAEIFGVIVPKDAKVTDMSIISITESENFPSQCTFIAVYNKEKEEFSIPRGNQVIRENDQLFLISTAEHIKEAADFLTAQTNK